MVTEVLAWRKLAEWAGAGVTASASVGDWAIYERPSKKLKFQLVFVNTKGFLKRKHMWSEHGNYATVSAAKAAAAAITKSWIGTPLRKE